MRSLYGELSEKFGRFVEVLAEISDKTSLRTEKDILRLYEVWVRPEASALRERFKRRESCPTTPSRRTGSNKGHRMIFPQTCSILAMKIAK